MNQILFLSLLAKSPILNILFRSFGAESWANNGFFKGIRKFITYFLPFSQLYVVPQSVAIGSQQRLVNGLREMLSYFDG